jgi:hypothetical protein
LNDMFDLFLDYWHRRFCVCNGFLFCYKNKRKNYRS